ncbi:hypothetical protein BO71DRAFT_199876 [Aspergillus ellipticus CBS 707.79]|uniref:Uncharacterized protein n=1 Tax=Aspergillus ellipticus CBS 707.79 TaxID=1448320 RepID=A0A319DE46_9EURO|nr:hypothetical protein BO71DRAFT_199876 [Aspergillus ellipticus CBS 707.79]
MLRPTLPSRYSASIRPSPYTFLLLSISSWPNSIPTRRVLKHPDLRNEGSSAGPSCMAMESAVLTQSCIRNPAGCSTGCHILETQPDDGHRYIACWRCWSLREPTRIHHSARRQSWECRVRYILAGYMFSVQRWPSRPPHRVMAILKMWYHRGTRSSAPVQTRTRAPPRAHGPDYEHK